MWEEGNTSRNWDFGRETEIRNWLVLFKNNAIITSSFCKLCQGYRYGTYSHFQQYFSYIMAASFIGGGNGAPGEKHRSAQVTDKLYHIM